MTLSDFQKKITKQIIENKHWNINLLYSINFPTINENSEIDKIEEYYYNILEYLKLIEDLKKENLIFITDYSNTISLTKPPKAFKLVLDISNKKDFLLEKINFIFKQNINLEINSTLSLEKFAKRYKTKKEINTINIVKYPTIISCIMILLYIITLIVSYNLLTINKKEFLSKVEPKIETRPIHDTLNKKGSVKGIRLVNIGENDICNIRVGLSYRYYYMGKLEPIKLSNYRYIKVPYDWGLTPVTEKLKTNESTEYNFDTNFIKSIESNFKITKINNNQLSNNNPLEYENYFIVLFQMVVKYDRIPDLKEYREKTYLIGKEMTPINKLKDTILFISPPWLTGENDEILERIKIFEGIKD